MNSEKILCIYRSKIDIENVYGNTENVHPKILYFPKGKFGHKFWMTYSPYPKHISRYENPCIAVSEDLIHWDTPTGKENSCLDDLSYTHTEMVYNSDHTMVYNSREGCIEVWWRYVDDYKGVMILKRRKTYDGLYWKPTEEICEKNRKEQDYVSPSVLYEENYGYRVYYVHRRSVWCTFFFLHQFYQSKNRY